MTPDYDTWNYWLACYADKKTKKANLIMARTPANIKMIDMMQNFIKDQPPMGFTPTVMYIGRVLDNKQGRQCYDDDSYQSLLDAILSLDKNVFTDMCITELVRAKSLVEFNAYQKAYPEGRTFDQLDSLIRSSKKKK